MDSTTWFVSAFFLFACASSCCDDCDRADCDAGESCGVCIGGYDIGPLLADGGHACRLSCGEIDCRDYDYVGGYIGECHASVDYVYACVNGVTTTLTFVSDGCPPGCWYLRRSMESECRQ